MESKTSLQIRVGPFYDGTEEDMIDLTGTGSVARSNEARKYSGEAINDLHSGPRLLSIQKPSPAVLGKVKLKPCYVSFPPPAAGRSPTAPSFRVPRYGYFSISGDESFHRSFGHCDTAKMKESVVCAIGVAQNKQNLSFMEAVLNCINFYAGIGVLLLPYSFAVTGWSSVITLAILSVMSYYSGCCFGHCQVKYFLQSIPEIAEFAFETKGRNIISMTYYLQLLLDVAIFGRLLSELVCELTHFSVFQANIISLTILIAMVNIFRRNQITSFLSIIGNIAFLLMVLAISFSIIDIQDGYEPSSTAEWMPEGLHETVGIQMYCLSGHIVLPAIIRSMHDSFRYDKLLRWTFATLFIIYTTLGSLGYFYYGNTIHGNIIDALQRGSVGHITSMIACTVVLATKIPLASAPIAEGIADFIESWIQTQAPRFSFTDFENDYYNTVIRKRLQRIKRKRRYYQQVWGEDEETKDSLSQSEAKMQGITFSPNIGSRRESLQGMEMQKVPNNTKCDENSDSSSSSSPSIIDWEKDLRPSKPHASVWFLRFLIRSFVQTVAILIAQVIVGFEQMVILIGGSLGIITTIVIPITCYWRVARYDLCCWEHSLLWAVTFLSTTFVVYALLAPLL